MSVHFILYILAAVCFLLAAVNTNTSRINLTAAGLFCWVLTLLVR